MNGTATNCADCKRIVDRDGFRCVACNAKRTERRRETRATPEARAAHTAYQIQYQARLIAEGRCRACCRVRDVGGTAQLCAACRVKQRERMRARQARRVAVGCTAEAKNS